MRNKSGGQKWGQWQSGRGAVGGRQERMIPGLGSRDRDELIAHGDEGGKRGQTETQGSDLSRCRLLQEHGGQVEESSRRQSGPN